MQLEQFLFSRQFPSFFPVISCDHYKQAEMTFQKNCFSHLEWAVRATDVISTLTIRNALVSGQIFRKFSICFLKESKYRIADKSRLYPLVWMVSGSKSLRALLTFLEPRKLNLYNSGIRINHSPGGNVGSSILRTVHVT